jgi:hypothetical protein
MIAKGYLAESRDHCMRTHGVAPQQLRVGYPPPIVNGGRRKIRLHRRLTKKSVGTEPSKMMAMITTGRTTSLPFMRLAPGLVFCWAQGRLWQMPGCLGDNISLDGAARGRAVKLRLTRKMALPRPYSHTLTSAFHERVIHRETRFLSLTPFSHRHPHDTFTYSFLYSFPNDLHITPKFAPTRQFPTRRTLPLKIFLCFSPCQCPCTVVSLPWTYHAQPTRVASVAPSSRSRNDQSQSPFCVLRSTVKIL